MKFKSIIFTLCVLIIPAIAAATPNLIMNGDFESGLDYWDYSGSVAVGPTTGVGINSPSGDGSNFAGLVSDDSTPNSSLWQNVDMNGPSMFRLQFDFSIATFEESWGDDFRAEMWINFPGGGPFTPIFSYGSGAGFFEDWDPINWPGLKYYNMQGFTYDFWWENPEDNMILTFHTLGYNADGKPSALYLDNLTLTAIPEPGSIMLMLVGAGFAAFGLRRRFF